MNGLGCLDFWLEVLGRWTGAGQCLHPVEAFAIDVVLRGFLGELQVWRCAERVSFGYDRGLARDLKQGQAEHISGVTGRTSLMAGGYRSLGGERLDCAVG
jgi:hypothetical protein